MIVEECKPPLEAKATGWSPAAKYVEECKPPLEAKATGWSPAAKYVQELIHRFDPNSGLHNTEFVVDKEIEDKLGTCQEAVDTLVSKGSQDAEAIKAAKRDLSSCRAQITKAFYAFETSVTAQQEQLSSLGMAILQHKEKQRLKDQEAATRRLKIAETNVQISQDRLLAAQGNSAKKHRTK